MEENKQATEEAGKEAKKIEAKFEGALRKLTALMGPEWSKPTKLGKDDMPEIMQRIVEEKKEELFKKFQEGYVGLVEKKKKLDRTIAEKEREFKKVVLEEKKAFLKEVDTILQLITQMDQIEREYYQTLGTATAEEDSEAAEGEPQN